MIEEYEDELINVKFTKKEILKIMSGKIIQGHKIKAGLVLE